MNDATQVGNQTSEVTTRAEYLSPQLIRYGFIADLTNSGTSGDPEGTGGRLGPKRSPV